MDAPEAVRRKIEVKYNNKKVCLTDKDHFIDGKDWYQLSIHALVPRWRKAIELRGDFVENWDI
jgi:hypothetical protein